MPQSRGLREAHLVVGDARWLVRMFALNDGIVVRGGTCGKALLRLVAGGAVGGLIGIEGQRGVLLVQHRDGWKQLLNQAKNLHGYL